MGNRFASLPIFSWHKQRVHVPRVERLTRAVTELVPRASSMLDVGCGDGTLARGIAEQVGAASDLHGVDILIRPEAVVNVQSYDGRHLPFENCRFDLVTICDVLHHADDPAAVLREAIRVLTPSGSLVIKDHFKLGRWSDAVLLAMDVIGNYAPGVLVTGDYMTPAGWMEIVTNSGGAIDKLRWPLEIHDMPWRLVAKSDYQFAMRVKRSA